ncbi:MAG: hypothetical protein AAB403_03675 [Planctomycetota bacterium]|mgnify:CR=1 FL=1
MHKKQLYARVSTSAGEILSDWHDIDFRGYTKQLNAGPSECVLGLGVAFDYDRNDLQVGNDVKLILSDIDTATGTEAGESGALVIYQGYISLIERDVDGSRESVTVHLLGYYTRLALDYLKNGSQTTLYSNSTTGLTTVSASQSAADIGLMMRAVIDRYIAETTNPRISYAGSYDIPDTSTTASYRFEQKTYKEAMDDLASLAPANVYWYVSALGVVTFKSKPTTSTHVFQFGKHFTSVHVEHSLEKVRNVALVWDGKTASYVYKHYQDDASISVYGRRGATINDFGIDASGAADAIGAKFLAENKDPAIKVTCTVLDNNAGNGTGYDIESIQPGDTCSFVGFSSGLSDIFNDNMLITRVDYRLDTATIEVEIVQSGLLASQAHQGRAINDIGSGGLGVPESYT